MNIHSSNTATVSARVQGLILLGALVWAAGLTARAQQAGPDAAAPQPGQPNASAPAAGQQPAQTQAPAATPAAETQPAAPAVPAATGQTATPQSQPGTAGQSPASAPAAKEPAGAELPGGITDEQLKQLLLGKALYLRGGYLDNSLSFNEHGGLIGHSAQGSYTLNGVEINKIRLTKHKVELEGLRYGLHFLGALPYEDPTKAVDRVRITPKKKMLKITIDREMVVKPKKVKEKAVKGGKAAPAKAGPAQAAQTAPATTQKIVPSEADSATSQPVPSAQTTPATSQAAAPPEATPATPPGAPAQGAAAASQPAEAAEPAEMSEADQLKAAIAAAPAAERPADPKSVTTTISPAHATMVLKDALDKIFAQGLDERMMASMPDFWKLYYQAAAAKTDYRPKDAAVLRQNTVDKKARLLSTFEPGSNEFAQANGVAGMALYHTVIGADGKPGEIAVARPIGFGLDESAVDAIRGAKFEAAIKDGKPVAVLLDLVVQFRIYSKRTAVESKPAAEKPEEGKAEGEKPAAPVLPGPYSRQHP